MWRERIIYIYAAAAVVACMCARWALSLMLFACEAESQFISIFMLRSILVMSFICLQLNWATLLYPLNLSLKLFHSLFCSLSLCTSALAASNETFSDFAQIQLMAFSFLVKMTKHKHQFRFHSKTIRSKLNTILFNIRAHLRCISYPYEQCKVLCEIRQRV